MVILYLPTTSSLWLSELRHKGRDGDGGERGTLSTDN